MTEVWEQAKCWMCKSDLKEGKKFKDQWVCVKCKDSYLKCHGCEEKGEIIFEWSENLKGTDCLECDHFFCSSCMQSTGKCIDSDEEDNLPPGKEDRIWKCDKCVNK